MDKLLQVAKQKQPESMVKAVMSAARLAEKFGWIARMVQPGDCCLVAAIELRRSTEERAATKEWAQIDDIANMAKKAGTPAGWEVVALACILAAHYLQ